MPTISQKQVLHLAELAKLNLTPQEVDIYQKELTVIINFIDQLQKVDVDQFLETKQVSQLSNVSRADKINEKLNLDLTIFQKNATLNKRQFEAPKVNL